MSKVVVSLTTFILAFMILLSFPKLTQANDCTLPGCTVTTNPAADAIFQDTQKITIDVNNPQKNFDPNIGYTFSAWNVAANENECLVGVYSKNSNSNGNMQLTVTPEKITASWQIAGLLCRSKVGQYKFQLWSGQGTQDRNTSSMIADYPFTIQQTGGGIPVLTPLQQTVQLGTKPTVLVSNARVDQSYTFWWQDSKKSPAAMKKVSAADLNNGILFVPIELIGETVSFKAGETKKLCMEIGDYTGITGITNVTCHFSTSFTFSNNPPPVTGIQCSLLPSQTPTTRDDVSLKITNAIPGISYGGFLKKDGETISNIGAQTVDATRTLILPLGQKLSPGVYLPYVYNTAASSTDFLQACTIGFTVGNTDLSNDIKDVCKEEPEKCTSGGGKTTSGCTDETIPDPKDSSKRILNPAISTAIGCIHTNPSVLVQDFLRFTLGISGGLAFLMMLLGAFQMLTSAGNPETLSAGRSRVTSAIIGLLFVIFSILLLQIIGVSILNIPGFNKI